MSSRAHIDELIRIVSLYSARGNRKIFKIRSFPSKTSLLAQAFLSRQELTEREIARATFGIEAESLFYRVIRTRLLSRLQGLLFHLDLSSGSNLRKITYENNRKVFIVKSLVLLSAWKPALRIFPKAIQQARQFELTLNRIELLNIVSLRAATTGDSFGYHRHSEELESCISLWLAENKIEKLQRDLEVELTRAAPKRIRMLAKAESTREELELIHRDHRTFRVGLAYYRSATVCEEVARRYKEGRQLCSEAENVLSDYPHMSSVTFSGEFALKRLAYSLFDRDVAAGKEAADRCAKYFGSGRSNNWFVYKEYDFLLQMHTLNFEAAEKIHAEVAQHPRLNVQPDQVQQKWVLFRMHLDLVRGNGGNKIPESFRAFVEDVPIFAKDKAGYNVSLLILHAVILIRAERLNEVVSRTDALASYATRHLRNAATQRAFIRALVLLEKANFDFEDVCKRSPVLIGKFRDEIAQGPPDDCQVLPYGYIWDLIGASLKSREKRLARHDRQYAGEL